MECIFTLILGTILVGAILWLVGTVSSNGNAKGGQALSAGFDTVFWFGFFVVAVVIGLGYLDKIGVI